MRFILWIFFFQGENALAAVPEESRHEGKISFKVYRKYFTAGANYFVIFILIVFNILAQVSFWEPQIILNVFWVCEVLCPPFNFLIFLILYVLVPVMFHRKCLSVL